MFIIATISHVVAIRTAAYKVCTIEIKIKAVKFNLIIVPKRQDHSLSRTYKIKFMTEIIICPLLRNKISQSLLLKNAMKTPQKVVKI